MENENTKATACSRRAFLQTVGVQVPTLSLMMAAPGVATAASAPAVDTEKFTPLDLDRYFTASTIEFGPRDNARSFGRDSQRDGLVRVPAGRQTFRGVPFALGPEGTGDKRWVVLSTCGCASTTAKLEIPLGQSAGYVCLAAFCDWDKNDPPPPGKDYAEEIGKVLGEVQMVYEDGSEKSFPLRRRFEVSPPRVGWGHVTFTAVPHQMDGPRRLTDSLPNGMDWGNLQEVVENGGYNSGPGTLWLSALENPEPARPLRALRLRAASDDSLVICGITLFHGREHPLRFEPLALYRFTLPEATDAPEEGWKVKVDLGIVGRTYAGPSFEPEAWLGSSRVGLGEPAVAQRAVRHLYAEVVASRAATLVLTETKSGTSYQFDLAELEAGKELEGKPSGARVEILEPQKAWLHARVLDAATRHPTPVRLALRSPGRTVYSTLRPSRRDQRRVVPGLWRRLEIAGHVLRVCRWHVPGGTAGGGSVRRDQQRVRVPASAQAAQDRARAAHAGA